MCEKWHVLNTKQLAMNLTDEGLPIDTMLILICIAVAIICLKGCAGQ